MSLKSDEFEEMNYSFILSEKDEEKEYNKSNNQNNKDNGKISLTKCLSSSGLNIKKLKNINIFPEINIKKKNKIGMKKKMNRTSNSLNSLKNNSFSENAYRTYNFKTNLINNNNKQKNIKISDESNKKLQEHNLTENSKKIKANTNNNNFVEIKPNLVNILNTKNDKNTKEERDKVILKDSQRIKKEYNNIQIEYLKQRNSLNSLKEEEKISKNEELEMENKVLSEQINKLNYLYFDVLHKLIEYEESIKNIHKLKESKIKNDYILLELEYKYNQVSSELNKSNKKIEELKYLLHKNNIKLKQCQKNLDYYFQLNQKLLIDAENIYMSPKFLALKNDYESQINENKKKLAFYKEENYKKDKIILEFNCGNKNINELYNSVNTVNSILEKNCYFKNAQKLSKEYFIKNKEKKENKEIISLKNKINILKEKIDKLEKKNKEYEANERCLKRYHSNHQLKKSKKIILNNNDDNNFIKNNIKLNAKKLLFEKVNIENFTIKNKEDDDIDFMSNLNMNEFLYVLKKCFEAQYIHIKNIDNQIFDKSTFNLLKSNKKTNYKEFITKISNNFCKVIKVTKNRDKNDISSFVKTFLFNNFIENGNDVDEFHRTFIDSFKDIIIYEQNMEEKYIKKLAKYLKDKINKLREEFEFIDLNKKGNISFIALKKVIEKQKINLKNDILEYMIFFMKRASINDINNLNCYSLKNLNYVIFLNKISSIIKKSSKDLDNDSYTNLSEIENNNNFDGDSNGNITEDNSLIEITNEEYNEKISVIMNSITSEILKKSNKNTEEYINKLFQKYIFSDEQEHQKIELNKLVEEIKNSLFIELNQIDIFCLYSKFQINESKNNLNNTETIDFKSFKNEILCYANQLQNAKKNNELIKNNNFIKKENKENTNLKDINDINGINEKEEKKVDSLGETKNPNEEYNDFEKNNFDYEI